MQVTTGLVVAYLAATADDGEFWINAYDKEAHEILLPYSPQRPAASPQGKAHFTAHPDHLSYSFLYSHFLTVFVHDYCYVETCKHL